MIKISSICWEKNRILSILNSDAKIENPFKEIKTDADNTMSSKFEGVIPDRIPPIYIFKDVIGLTGNRNIIPHNVSAFSLIINNHMFKNIRIGIEAEIHQILKKDWILSGMLAFIGILYVGGAYEGKILTFSYL